MKLPFTYRATLSRTLLLLLMIAPTRGQGQPRTQDQADATNSSSPSNRSKEDTTDNRNNCFVHRVTGLPGSHQFASDFIEAIAGDPSADADPDLIWGLTADLSNKLQSQERAMYLSRSSDGGATWTQIARLDSRYFEARIGEGLRNGFLVSPDATYFLITTQRGAFQVFPQSNPSEPLVKPIPGPRVPDTPPRTPITKKPGDPLRANVVEITPDGQHLLIGYGYFDLEPQLLQYHKEKDGSWAEDGPIPNLPTEMDLLSINFDDPKSPSPGFVYVGTGDQVYLLNLHSQRWSRVQGVGPDSAIHGMSVVGGLHLAACWGVYNPSGPGSVRRVINARFLLHRSTDETGSNVRAYTIEVDPSKPNREVVTSLTGVYTSQDSGETWTRINDLPEEEFRTAHFNSDGTLLISGIAGTFLVNPFVEACTPHLKTRER